MCLIVATLIGAAGRACGRGSSQEAASEVPVDLVSESRGGRSAVRRRRLAMDETVQKNYRVLLDGASDTGCGVLS